MADVFVSYARKDKARVAPLVAAIESNGWSVWWDREIAPGQEFDRLISDELAAACAVLVVWTRHSVESRWVRGEARDGADRGILVPVRFDGATLPIDMRAIHTIDLDDAGEGTRVEDMLHELGAMIARRRTPLPNASMPGPAKPAPHSAPAAARRGWNNKRLYGIAALLVALAAGWFYFSQPTLRKIGASPASVGAPMPTADHLSIAVLPFVNMSADKDQEYFSDGLSEELLNTLAQVPQLRVIARSSSFSFKGKDAAVADIARALNVAYLLEGSVRRSGATVRITAQIIRVTDSSNVWSQSYDRQLDDVFKVQNEIAGAVVAALKVKLLPSQQVGNPHQTSNSQAYTQYLLGKQFLNRASADGYRRAVAAYRQAITLDPDYAAAYAGLATAEVYAADSAETAAENAAAKQRGLAAADKAIALAPGQADGYATRGWMRANFLWDWNGARADLEKALAIDPNNSTVQRRYGQLLGSQGMMPEAIAAIRKSVSLDPLSAPPWSNLGYYLMAAGQMPEARQALEHALTVNPESSHAQANLATLELLQGNTSKALEMFRYSDDASRYYGVAMAEYSLGHHRESQQSLDALTAGYAHDWAFQIAEVYAWRGDKDKAFEWLDRAYAQHDGGLSDIKFDPLLAGLREDRRFAVLLGKMGLE